ncbi:hypothetical protein LINPERPRIM_LOCUS18483 [Linum perenne]
MKLFSACRRIARILESPIPVNAASSCRHFSSFESRIVAAPSASLQWLLHQQNDAFARFPGHYAGKSCFSTESNGVENNPTDAVKELHEKILESVKAKRTMAPNAWSWSVIEKCQNSKDIELLFDCLENLRRFRLSNLRIHDNFNCSLCREIAKACTRVGAIDFAPILQKYAKDHNDAKLMVEVMDLMKKNDVPLQPSTADIVFRSFWFFFALLSRLSYSRFGIHSICNNVDKWDLIQKYSKKFSKAGVQLRRAAFDAWMDFAAKRGDTKTLWEIEKLRSQTMKQHSLVTGFSCVKTLSETKKSGIVAEFQKLVSEWPVDVIKHCPQEEKKALASALKSDIPATMAAVLNMGLEVNVDIQNLNSKLET